jgi:hypothetical protein
MAASRNRTAPPVTRRTGERKAFDDDRFRPRVLWHGY